MIGEFLTWWSQQLLSLRPERASAREGDAMVATLQEPNPGSIHAGLRRNGKMGALGVFALTDGGMAGLGAALGPRRPPVEVRLPPGMMLEQAIVLPLAAERDPESVLRFEMDRLTPFSAQELYWTWEVARRDRVQGQLHLRLSLVLRAQVEDALQMLRQAGLHPVALTAAGGRVVALDAAAAGRWRRWGTVVLAAACVLLAVAAVVIPFVQQSIEAGRIERRIAALQPAVDRAEALRRSLATATAGIDVLSSQRALVGDPLAVLATLTDILPDDTVLTDLALRQRVITISGQSGAAARLIPALAADPGLRNPAFTAPVTHNETMHNDGFSMRADSAAGADMAPRSEPGTP